MNYLFVYITAGSKEEAKSIGKALLQDRLVACVNILDNMNSMYWWDDNIQDDQEVIMIAKTRADLFDKLSAKVREHHSYDCPCIVALPLEKGTPDYLQWINNETSP